MIDVVNPIVLSVVVICGFAAAVHAQTTRSASGYDLDHPWDFKPTFKDKAEWEQRANRLRTRTLVALGLHPMPEKTPLNPVVHGKIDRGEYTVEKVSFASVPGHYVTGNLYRPKNRTGKLPAVLSPHGHWPGGRFMWRSDADAQKEIDSGAEGTINSARSPLQARCAMLARMGCVVFHYDMLGYADSTVIKHREGFDDAEATLRLQSQLGLQVWNGIRGLDFLCELPDVDPSRLAVTGASGGGTQTFLVCATDDRPAVAFPAVMVSMAMQGGCVCENAPLLRIGTNNVELACLFAPKPLGMSGANDWTKDVETRGLPEAKAIYGLYGAGDRVAAKHFPFPHNFNQPSREYMYEWMNRHLKLGWETPVKERPFEPVPPEQLSVYDDAHPRPADEKDAAALRAAMTERSDAQLAALQRDNKKHREMLDGALSAMLAYPSDWDRVQPMRLMIPDKWTGRIVVWAGPKSPAADRLFNGGVGLVIAEFAPLGRVEPTKRGSYHGFTLGYNRSPITQQVVDVSHMIDAARRHEGVKSVEVVGAGEIGPAAVLACAMAGDEIRRAVVNVNGFDFPQIKDATDGRILPGALKYGGLRAFSTLGPIELVDDDPAAIVGRLLK